MLYSTIFLFLKRNLFTFAAATSDNGARYRCEARNQLSPYPLSAEINLSVQCETLNFFIYPTRY